MRENRHISGWPFIYLRPYREAAGQRSLHLINGQDVALEGEERPRDVQAEHHTVGLVGEEELRTQHEHRDKPLGAQSETVAVSPIRKQVPHLRLGVERETECFPRCRILILRAE